MPAISPPVPLVAGIGLRSPHVSEVLERFPPAGWFEVHAENYMTCGAASGQLEHIRSRYPLSIHGVGLSLGSAGGIDPVHLNRLKEAVDRFEPGLVSEHLAWSSANGVYFNDLLPLPYDEEALRIVSENISRTQEKLGRQILIENLSAYVGFARSTMREEEFLYALVKRTGCGLLLDVNNVYVSAQNLGFDPLSYIKALPSEAIGEIHLAGHVAKETDAGQVLIDNHGSRVAPQVWKLYRDTVAHVGHRPTLIEWDSELPAISVLMGEALWADLVANSATLPSPAQSRLGHDIAPVWLDDDSSTPVGVCDHHPLSLHNRHFEGIHG